MASGPSAPGALTADGRAPPERLSSLEHASRSGVDGPHALCPCGVHPLPEDGALSARGGRSGVRRNDPPSLPLTSPRITFAPAPLRPGSPAARLPSPRFSLGSRPPWIVASPDPSPLAASLERPHSRGRCPPADRRAPRESLATHPRPAPPTADLGERAFRPAEAGGANRRVRWTPPRAPGSLSNRRMSLRAAPVGPRERRRAAHTPTSWVGSGAADRSRPPTTEAEITGATKRWRPGEL